MVNQIEAKITNGAYMGDPVKITFKPYRVYVDNKDVTKDIVSLVIDISHRGWLVHVVFAETSPKLIGGEK